MGIEKSYNIDNYIQKLIWLESISANMKLNNKGWLVWDTYFDGELFTLNIKHVLED